MSDLPTRVRGLLPRDETADGGGAVTGRHVAGLLALLPAVAILLVRVGINAPFAPDLPYATLYDPVATLAHLGPAVAALLLSVTTDDDVLRVGTAFAGVFGLLSAAAGAAVVPASVALVGATGLVVVANAGRPLSADEAAESLVGLAFVAGAAFSLAGSLGIEPALTRRVGSTLGLLAIAGAPVFVRWDRRSVFAGLLAGVAFAGFGLGAPFVTGAASLIGGGIVGTSLPVLVLAVVGGVTLTATGVLRRRPSVVLAGTLLLAAGVPATVPRALTLVVGLTLLTTTEARR